MKLIIKNINVINANLFACPYTAGISLMSFSGLFDKIQYELIEIDSKISLKKFGIIVHSIDNKIDSNIIRDTSCSDSKKGQYTLPSLLPLRYFNFSFSLILDIENDDDEDFKTNISHIINNSKVQSGIIGKEIKNKQIEIIKDDLDLLKHINPFSYLITDAIKEVEEEKNAYLNKDIIDIYVDILQKDSQYKLYCNGFIKIEKSSYKRKVFIKDQTKEIQSYFVDSNLALMKNIPLFFIKKNHDLLKNYMFIKINEKERLILKGV